MHLNRWKNNACQESSRFLEGFTVIELIVTITIITIFSTVSAVSFKGSQANTRDAERKTDVQTIVSNLESFYTSGSDSMTTCPKGFISVPGNSTYSTADFCVMKYEAKESDSGKAVSTPSGVPWVSIPQVDTVIASQAACDNCHLITNNEWMTIAQNIMMVGSNWTGGGVGSGSLYTGHNDSVPANPLAADSNDLNGYYGTGNSSSSGANQRRTFTLSNGEVIWDFAGNVWDWTAETVTTNQPGYSDDTTYYTREWNSSTLLSHSFPWMVTSVPGFNSNWNSTNQGVGTVKSYYNQTGERGILRGGRFADGTAAGIFATSLNVLTSNVSANFGFRVVYSDSTKTLTNQKTGRYPSTKVIGKETTYMSDLDKNSLTSPTTAEGTSSLVAATNNTQTTGGVSPQPTTSQYVYQPLKADGNLCTSELQTCTKFNIYYRLESDNTVYKITSKNQ